MKKLFFFRSSNGNNNQASPPSADKKIHCEKTADRVKKSRINKRGSEEDVFGSTPCLRRSLSFSSGSVYDTNKGLMNHVEQNGSLCSTSYYSRKPSNLQTSRSRTLTPERQNRTKYLERAIGDSAHRAEKSDFIASRAYSDLSESSSYCSSNVSNKVLDRYIDGEQQTGNNELKAKFPMNNQFDKGNVVVKQTPRLQCAEPLPHDSRKQKPSTQSSRETKFLQLHLSSKASVDDDFDHKSPRKLAREVVERLSQSQMLPEMRSQEMYPDSPITIEDIYSRNLTRHSAAYTDEIAQKDFITNGYSETDGSHREDVSELSEKQLLPGNKVQVRGNIDALNDSDMELFKKFKVAEDRAEFLSEELEQGNLLEGRGLSLPILTQIIISLMEEKVSMAVEVSTVLHDRIAEKALLREELKRTSLDLDSQTRRLEKEKYELQTALEKELDRRSTEWSLKLEKYQTEEHRLRERVRELAEQNVSLQREVSSLNERENSTKAKIISSDKELEDLGVQIREAREANHFLQTNLSELIDKSKSAEEDQDYIRKHYEEKVTECKDMHQAISRLQRTCCDQEKTIDGLREFCDELGKQVCNENFNFGLARLQMEQMRLTGVEHALRKEVDSSRVEIDSLRRENINLLNRLKDNGHEGTFSTFKLDQELQNHINCLTDQVLPLLTESNQLCRKLLGNIKSNAGCTLKTGSNFDTSLSGQVLEFEVELQRLNRAAENITSSTGTISSVLHEKSMILHEKIYPVAAKSQSPNLGDESSRKKDTKLMDVVISELKAEVLLTSLLREKLYSKELSIEQLQAELAAAVRGNDVLKCEVQHAMDSFSCVNHKLKDLELQMMKKDEIANQLEGDLQECKKELALVKAILPKVSKEKDMMWEEVRQYSETNMLLKSEINMLRKKIEALDEDILLKEGQITILKDSIHKPFDLLA